jgi:hypothetical protein
MCRARHVELERDLECSLPSIAQLGHGPHFSFFALRRAQQPRDLGLDVGAAFAGRT